MQQKRKITSAFFITFSGDCKKALTFYQSCFGGELHFETFAQPLAGINQLPVVSGSLVCEKFTLLGSDLIPDQGRKVGNFMAIYIHCGSPRERADYLKKLVPKEIFTENDPVQKLIEITDSFAVSWIFGI